MPRIARIVVEGFPHHIIQRGNNRQNVFFDDGDRRNYYGLLAYYEAKWNCEVLAHCLMPNHVHLVAEPAEREGLAKMMQAVSLCYTQYVNRKYGRTGRLWECRYHSCLVDREVYLWAVCRYVDTNAVRAGLVRRPEDYKWSSARAHVHGTPDRILGQAWGKRLDPDSYRAYLSEAVSQEEIALISQSTYRGQPLAGDSLRKSLEKRLRCSLSHPPRGRPRGPQRGVSP